MNTKRYSRIADEAVGHLSSITTILINGYHLPHFSSRIGILRDRELVACLVEDWSKLTAISDVNNRCDVIGSNRIALVSAPDGQNVTGGGLKIKSVANSQSTVDQNRESIGSVPAHNAEDSGSLDPEIHRQCKLSVWSPPGHRY